MKWINTTMWSRLWQFGWHFLFAFLAILTLLSVLITVVASAGAQTGETPQSLVVYVGISIFLAVLALFAAIFGILVLTFENIRSIKSNRESLDNLAELLMRNRNLLGTISQSVQLSDGAKEIAFRDNDRLELQEAVLGKLHQHDFDSTFEMIEAMERRTEYVSLAQNLRQKAEQYKDATEEQRIRQAAAHVEQLMDQHLWAEAAIQAEYLAKTFPESELTAELPRRMRHKKSERKRDLLKSWDEAVKAHNVDQSLEILKELDQYLTPTEGLALQESASTVFKTKLHNLGVTFSMAVTERNWIKALEEGRKIVQGFPNSRMAFEIRSKMDVLQKRAKEMQTEKTA